MNNKRPYFTGSILIYGLVIFISFVLFFLFSRRSGKKNIQQVTSTAVDIEKIGKKDVVSGDINRNSDSRNIIIDHTNFEWYDNQSQEIFDRIAALKVYFAHASVGDNIMSGFAALNKTNPSKYPLSQKSAGASPPAQLTNGMIYHYSRGNPGWKAKISDFETFIQNGWYYPKVDISMNKFCYIDQDADVTTYLASMAALEADNPDTKFVYFTMPLSTEKNSKATRRAQFNIDLRNWIATQNDKLFFDLADVESTTPGDANQTFSYNGMNYENLYPKYTRDGGHLNDMGSQRAAIGLYSLFGQLVSSFNDLQ